MSLGPVMLDLAGPVMSPEERQRLLHPQVGGVILFSRNYESPGQLRALTGAIHALRSPRLLIAVDQEGGRVQRFRDGFTRLPPVAELGRIDKADRQRAQQLAQITGWLMAAELRALGVDLSFAPVLDLDYGCCPAIGDRAFHARPERVAELASAYRRGMAEAGMAAVGKHFPGHGHVREDSHVAMPVDTRDLDTLRERDLLPYIRLIDRGLPGVMAAHVIYPAVDERPAGFSPVWLAQILRTELAYQGVIFSDDLSMAGAAGVGDYPERARAALGAGCDMVLVCNQPDAAVEVLDSLQGYDDPAAHLRLVRLHGRTALDWDSLHQDERWRAAVAAVKGYDDAPLLDMDM